MRKQFPTQDNVTNLVTFYYYFSLFFEKLTRGKLSTGSIIGRVPVVHVKTEAGRATTAKLNVHVILSIHNNIYLSPSYLVPTCLPSFGGLNKKKREKRIVIYIMRRWQYMAPILWFMLLFSLFFFLVYPRTSVNVITIE